jgi:dipeptidyl-peptidase-4
MIRPPDFDESKSYPVLMYVYGGPGSQTVRNSWGGSNYLWYQMLAQKGYIIVSVDNRGTGARGDDFKTVTYKNLGKWETHDQIEAAKYLATLPYVNKDRIGIWGWSYGGYMTLMCLLNAPDYFQAGVSGAPVTDWQLYDTHYTERYLGLPTANAAGYTASAVMPYAGNLRAPLLVMHGMADDNVLFTHSTRLFGALQKLNKPFDVMTYPGSKHGLLRHADTGLHGYGMITRFFDQSLKEK